jgi:PEP-CTERM putative exosortase interaction domain
MKTKNTLMVAATLFAALGLQAAYLTAPIKIDTRFVGDAGNAADSGGTAGTGAVAYDYYIGTTEVTAGQYASFLNAVASKSDVNGLYNAGMYSNTHGCGIQQLGNATDGYTYVATKGDNMPVNFVSVYDAMRFCNWLSTGNTETGVYVFTGANNISLVVRNDAAWQAGGIAIASLDEWYKAAFYQGNGTYSTYANGTNVAPTAEEANYNNYIGTITDVDFGAASHYGTYGQNGNVWEWTDTVVGTATNVYRRGGEFSTTASNLGASNNSSNAAANEFTNVGFRVSSLQPIPEPSTYAAIFGALALAVAVYRRRK